MNESCGYLYNEYMYKQNLYMLSGYVKWQNHTNTLSMYRLPHEHNTHVNQTYTKHIIHNIRMVQALHKSMYRCQCQQPDRVMLHTVSVCVCVCVCVHVMRVRARSSCIVTG